MADVITDLKRLHIITGLPIADCKNAYELCDRDIDKAREYLLAADKGGEREGRINDKKSYKLGRNKKIASVLSVLWFIFFVAAIVFLIIAITGAIEYFYSVAFFGVAFILFCCFAVVHSETVKLTKQNTDDFVNAELENIAPSVVYLHYDNEAVKCPHCGSMEILFKEKKFSKSKALLGATIFGTKGLVFGIPSQKRAKCKCADCNHTFEVVRR